MKNLVFPVVPEKKSYDWPVIDDIVYVLMSFLKYKAHESINEKTKSIVVSAKTSACSKRCIGWQFDDPLVQKELANYPKPITTTASPSGGILLQVKSSMLMKII